MKTNFGKVCGECTYCKAQDIVTGNPLIPKIFKVYCDCPKPPNYSRLVNPSDDYFTKYCDYFNERK